MYIIISIYILLEYIIIWLIVVLFAMQIAWLFHIVSFVFLIHPKMIHGLNHIFYLRQTISFNSVITEFPPPDDLEDVIYPPFGPSIARRDPCVRGAGG